jgi:hypothetical protein
MATGAPESAAAADRAARLRQLFADPMMTVTRAAREMQLSRVRIYQIALRFGIPMPVSPFSRNADSGLLPRRPNSVQAEAFEGRVQRLVALMREAALAGLVAPTNVSLAATLDLKSKGTPSALLLIAAQRGLLVVERTSTNSRVVRAPDGSWATRSALAKRAASAAVPTGFAGAPLAPPRMVLVDDQAAGERALAERLVRARRMLLDRVAEEIIATRARLPLREVYRLKAEARRAA